jgi:hypothetical protein
MIFVRSKPWHVWRLQHILEYFSFTLNDIRQSTMVRVGNELAHMYAHVCASYQFCRCVYMKVQILRVFIEFPVSFPGPTDTPKKISTGRLVGRI